MTLYFITGNRNKFDEVKQIIPQLELAEVDVPEVQDVDAGNIVKAKLLEALKHRDGEFIVEDTSLHLDCLNGLPGPFIKWFLRVMGAQGVADLVEKTGRTGAEAKTVIGYAKSKNDIHFFEGAIRGSIVQPRGTRFGWDPIFQPEGYGRTFAEMAKEEKNMISHRRKAVEKLKAFLAQRITT